MIRPNYENEDLLEKSWVVEVLKLRMSLSYRHKLELAVFGYVRLNYIHEIPDDITRICLDFYNKIEIVWDIFCDNVAHYVSDNGLKVTVDKRPPYSTFASSIGWNKGIHSYTLKQLDSEKYQFGPGIISSDELSRLSSDKEDVFLSTNNKDASGYCLDGTDVYELKDGNDNWLFQCSSLSDVDKGDTVTVLVDCDEWKVVFYINDEMVEREIDIDKNKTYHPVFTVWESLSVTVQLIETTIDVENYAKDAIQKSDDCHDCLTILQP